MRLVFAILIATSAACTRVDLDELTFTCRANRDCARGKLCDEVEGICKAPEDLTYPDASVRDTGGDEDTGDAEVADFGFPDATPPPDAGPQCVPSYSALGNINSWWCYNALKTELEDFAAANDARMVDIEVERTESDRRFAAVMIPNDGLMRSWTYSYRKQPDDRYPPLLRAVTLADLEIFSEDGQNYEAGVLPSQAYRCAHGFWWHTSASSEAIYRTKLDHQVSSPVIDVEEYGNGSAAYIANGSGSSTVSFHITADELLVTLADPTKSLLSFQAAPAPALFNAVIGAKSQFTPRVNWVYGLSAAELEAYAAHDRLQVADLEVYRSGQGRAFAARLIPTTTIAVERRNDSNRLASTLARATNSATVGVYLKEVRGEALVFYNERHAFPASHGLDAYLTYFAMDRAEGSTTLSQNTLIPVPLDPCNAASTSTVSTRLGTLMERTVADGDRASTAAIVNYFGRELIADELYDWSLKQTDFVATPGCEAPGVSSKSSLLDQAALYEYVHQCTTKLEPRWSALIRTWMQGQRGDPQGMRAAVSDLIEVEGASVDMTPGQRARFKMETELAYTADNLSSPPNVHRSIVGRVAIPYCGTTTPTVVRQRIYIFGMFVDGEAEISSAEAAIDEVKRELLRPLVRRSVASRNFVCFGP